jgi:outer membrane protein OmpA-like peptidoglycan-associated protein
MRMKDLTVIVALIAVLPLLHAGCASRDWTRGLFTKQEVDVDERLTQVEGQLGTQVDRLEGLGARVTGLEGLGVRVAGLESSVAETAETARGALARADVALAKADAVDKRLARVATQRSDSRPVRTRTLFSTIHVRFGFNRSELDDEAETALLSVVQELRENPGLTIDLEGFTDSTGARDYNLNLSLRRVDAVRRYLVAKGIESPRIIHSSAVGPLRDVGTPEEHKRRVTVKLMRSPD